MKGGDVVVFKQNGLFGAHQPAFWASLQGKGQFRALANWPLPCKDAFLGDSGVSTSKNSCFIKKPAAKSTKNLKILRARFKIGLRYR